MREEFLRVGVITTTHGLKGEVKVFPTTDDPARFLDLERVFLDTGKEKKELRVSAVRFFKNLVIVKFDGLDRIEDVERWRGKGLYVAREDAVELEEGEYFIADLIGTEVYTKDGKLGELKDVLQTGANDVYIVDSPQYGEVLIPAIRECILSVDTENNRMDVYLLPGLLPDEK